VPLTEALNLAVPESVTLAQKISAPWPASNSSPELEKELTVAVPLLPLIDIPLWLVMVATPIIIVSPA
jgi:hypothetical protein